MLEATPQKVLNDAVAVGEQTHRIIAGLIHQASHPLAYLRRCQGILRLKTSYGATQLESVSCLLNKLGQKMPRVADFERFLKNPKLLDLQIQPQPVQRKSNVHLRGQSHWYQSSTQGDLHDESA